MLKEGSRVLRAPMGDPCLWQQFCVGETAAEAGAPSEATQNCKLILCLGTTGAGDGQRGGGCDRDLPRLRLSLCLGYSKLSTEGVQGAKPVGSRDSQTSQVLLILTSNRVFCFLSLATLTSSSRIWKRSTGHHTQR